MPAIQSLLGDRPVVALRAEATALEAAQEMSRNAIGAVLVEDGGGRPCGIFTERDLMVRVIVPGRDPASVRLSEVMTRELFTVGPQSKVAEVRRQMQERHIRHVPVLQDGRVVGVVSLRDLLRADLAQTAQDLSDTRRYIQGEATGLPPAV